MLYDLNWLQENQKFPPVQEATRITRYMENEKLFESEHGDSYKAVYKQTFERLTRIIENFKDKVCYPVVFNYHRLMAVKLADLVCGESPLITSGSGEERDLKNLISDTEFNEKLHPTVLDMSRYGDAIWRLYKDEDTGSNNFTVWSPQEWFPVIMNDGTFRVKYHVLAWRQNISTSEQPLWKLHVQIHSKGSYERRTYLMTVDGLYIKKLESSETVSTGFEDFAVIQLCNLRTSSSIYGHDDYVLVDSVISEIVARVSQISNILDKHADPSMAGPETMLKTDKKTGESYFEPGKYYAIGHEDKEPKYVTWDGQLDSAFKQLELLINQLYILTEMGAAFAGAKDGSGQAISGTAMRFKMASALTKARRVANSLERPARKLISMLSGLTLKEQSISVHWRDGLPNDPREEVETARLATGLSQVMPLYEAVKQFFEKSPEEAKKWLKDILNDQTEFGGLMINQQTRSTSSNGNDPRVDPQEPNPTKKAQTVNNP